MNFLNKFVQQEPTSPYSEFWAWFKKNEKEFHAVVKGKQNIQPNFLAKLNQKLATSKQGILFLTGMYNDNTVELVVTADGDIRNVYFVEELVQASPSISGWKFTSLIPAKPFDSIYIEMFGIKFSSDNLFFYSNDLPIYPDEFSISVIHSEMTDENKQQIVQGTFVFLENYLGELEFLEALDNIDIIGPHEAIQPLIPVNELQAYLNGRKNEFVEKYGATRHTNEEDRYSAYELELKNGNTLLAIINQELLNWDSRPSYPWLSVFTIRYDGAAQNGMPNSSDYESMTNIENDIMQHLTNTLNIGRQTGDNSREIYCASKDFREPSKALFTIQQKYANTFAIEFDIFKDKYWQTFNRFRSN